jgi:glycosyltransferase involved in cell wall biosynthesis
MNLCFWWSLVSQHQSAYVRELAHENDVVVVAERQVSDDRKQLGWSVPELGKARIVIDPTQSQVQKLLRESGERIHILQGWKGCRLSRQVLSSPSRPSRLGVVVEACDERGARGFARTMYYRALLANPHSKVDFVLSMGSMGETYYRKRGIQPNCLFPFCYTVERREVTSDFARQLDADDKVHVSYIGQLCERKAVDILLRALHSNSRLDWQLDLVGDGPQMRELRHLCTFLNMEGRVHFRGTMDHRSALDCLSASDLLVLPSRFDGWGAVVNEALMLGVPVVCTDRCGASDLIRAPWLGSVVKAGSVSSLAEALGEWIRRGKKTSMQSEHIRDWTESIEGPYVAHYFSAVLEHVYYGAPRPVAPWRTCVAAPKQMPDVVI